MAQFYTLEEAARVLGMSRRLRTQVCKAQDTGARFARSWTVVRGDSALSTLMRWPAGEAWGATPSCGSPTWRSPRARVGPTRSKNWIFRNSNSE